MDHNASTSSHIFNFDTFNFDDELLHQWFNDLPPITLPQCENAHQDPVSSAEARELNVRVTTPLTANLTVECSQMKEPALGDVVGSSSRKGKQREESEKMKAVEIERQRRLEMSSLYCSLRSVLPAEYIRGKRSTADHLQEAIKYIKDMQGNIQKLNKKKDAFSRGKSSTSGSTCPSMNPSDKNTFNDSHNLTERCVTVRKCNDGFYNIELKTNGDNYEENLTRLPLSKALRLLSKERLSVVNTISSRVGNNVIHTINAQVDDGKDIDGCLLQQQMIDCYV